MHNHPFKRLAKLALPLALLCVFTTFAAGPEQDRTWRHPAPDSIPREKWSALPDTDVYEVVASKMPVAAVFDLAQKRIVPITEDQARDFTGHYYSCPKGKHPFLVRAVYCQGGTGHYEVSRAGDALLIFHGSLGHSSELHRSVLVVNLDFAPKEVYIDASIAE